MPPHFAPMGSHREHYVATFDSATRSAKSLLVKFATWPAGADAIVDLHDILH
jgi:hypothetical protein